MTWRTEDGYQEERGYPQCHTGDEGSVGVYELRWDSVTRLAGLLFSIVKAVYVNFDV